MGGAESAPVSSKEHEYSCGYRVINVHSGSPCHEAQLDVFFDFIVKANEVVLDRESDAALVAVGEGAEGGVVRDRVEAEAGGAPAAVPPLAGLAAASRSARSRRCAARSRQRHCNTMA